MSCWTDRIFSLSESCGSPCFDLKDLFVVSLKVWFFFLFKNIVYKNKQEKYDCIIVVVVFLSLKASTHLET